MGLFYWLITNLMRLALFMLCRWRVVGRENVPKAGPALVVSNHQHFMDPPLLAASLGRKLTFMSKEELFRTTFARLCITAFGAFPVRRGGADRQALRQALRLLERGKVVVMFPEGGRSPDGNLKQGHPGVAFLALTSGVPILPVAITGSGRVKRLRDYFRRVPITVTVGKPFRLARARGDQAGEMADLVMEHLAELLPPENRGVYRGDPSSAGAATRAD